MGSQRSRNRSRSHAQRRRARADRRNASLGIAPALSERLSEVLASLKGKDLTLLMSQSDMNHSRGLIDAEFTIERGANLAAG